MAENRRTERVRMMIENFYNEFMKGMTIFEIEEKYGVSKGYSYRILDEIAQKNGVNKEIFFQKEHGFHVFTDQNGRIVPNKSVSFREIYENLRMAEKLLNQTSKNLISLKDEMEVTLNEMENKEKEK